MLDVQRRSGEKKYFVGLGSAESHIYITSTDWRVAFDPLIGHADMGTRKAFPIRVTTVRLARSRRVDATPASSARLAREKRGNGETTAAERNQSRWVYLGLNLVAPGYMLLR
jgi:hypothetical protein